MPNYSFRRSDATAFASILRYAAVAVLPHARDPADLPVKTAN